MATKNQLMTIAGFAAIFGLWADPVFAQEDICKPVLEHGAKNRFTHVSRSRLSREMQRHLCDTQTYSKSTFSRKGRSLGAMGRLKSMMARLSLNENGSNQAFESRYRRLCEDSGFAEYFQDYLSRSSETVNDASIAAWSRCVQRRLVQVGHVLEFVEVDRVRKTVAMKILVRNRGTRSVSAVVPSDLKCKFGGHKLKNGRHMTLNHEETTVECQYRRNPPRHVSFQTSSGATNTVRVLAEFTYSERLAHRLGDLSAQVGELKHRVAAIEAPVSLVYRASKQARYPASNSKQERLSFDQRIEDTTGAAHHRAGYFEFVVPPGQGGLYDMRFSLSLDTPPHGYKDSDQVTMGGYFKVGTCQGSTILTGHEQASQGWRNYHISGADLVHLNAGEKVVFCLQLHGWKGKHYTVVGADSSRRSYPSYVAIRRVGP